MSVFKNIERSGTQQCQKCLKHGHYTFECTNERSYTFRPSATMIHKYQNKSYSRNKNLQKDLVSEKAPKRPKVRDDWKRSKLIEGSKSSSDDGSSSNSSSSDSDSNSDSNSDSSSISKSSKSGHEEKEDDYVPYWYTLLFNDKEEEAY